MNGILFACKECFRIMSENGGGQIFNVDGIFNIKLVFFLIFVEGAGSSGKATPNHAVYGLEQFYYFSGGKILKARFHCRVHKGRGAATVKISCPGGPRIRSGCACHQSWNGSHKAPCQTQYHTPRKANLQHSCRDSGAQALFSPTAGGGRLKLFFHTFLCGEG